MKKRGKLRVISEKERLEELRELRKKEALKKKSSNSILQRMGIVVGDIETLRDQIKSFSNKNSKTQTIRSKTEPNPTIEEFLKRHKLNLRMMYNAQGNEINVVRNEMIKLGAHFAYNTTKCKEGHTFRERSGHCVICNPSKIAFQLRKYEKGFVYIAGSINLNVVKIGITKDIISRQTSLNKDGYAGTSDWEIIYSFYLENNTGEIETLVKNSLLKHTPKKSFSYFKGTKIEAIEVFYCSFDKIHKELKSIILRNKFVVSKQVLKRGLVHRYQFKNLIKN